MVPLVANAVGFNHVVVQVTELHIEIVVESPAERKEQAVLVEDVFADPPSEPEENLVVDAQKKRVIFQFTSTDWNGDEQAVPGPVAKTVSIVFRLALGIGDYIL